MHMLTARLALVFTFLAAALPAAGAQPLALSFQNKAIPLSTLPVLREGRILVPAREAFTALGAAVFYDPHARLLAVRRGARTAIVTNVIVIADRSYVPLREITRALGLGVTFNAKTGIVDISEPQPKIALTWPVIRHRFDAPTVEDRHPLPNEQITAAFPTIYATIQTHGGPEVHRQSVLVRVDGADVTSRAQYVGDAITYTPAIPFALGPHIIEISGRDEDQSAFDQTWTFFSRYNPSQEPSTIVTSLFIPPGTYMYNDRVLISALGPPGASGWITISGLGTYPLLRDYAQPGYYYATIIVPANVYLPQAYVSGYFLVSGRRYELNTYERLSIDGTNAPSPRTVATTSPTPAPTVAPTAAPAPQVRTPIPPPVPRVPR